MTIAELLEFKEMIRRYANIDLISRNSNSIVDTLASIPTRPADVCKLTTVLAEKTNELVSAYQEVALPILEQIDNEILAEAAKFTTDEYINSRSKAQWQFRRHSSLPLTDEMQHELDGKISSKSDWHYPGLEICPESGDITSKLVGFDPLYIAAFSQADITNAISQFVPEYQARIRPYVINQHSLLDALPSNQFGFVICWNFFNYLMPHEIEKFITSITTVLRPGGVLLFSYNNSSEINGAKNAEERGMEYITKAALDTIIAKAGLLIQTDVTHNPAWHNVSWMVTCKPGTLSTIKAHQPIGLICDIE